MHNDWIACGECGTQFDAKNLARVIAHEHKNDPYPSECYFSLQGQAGCREDEAPENMCEACRERSKKG